MKKMYDEKIMEANRERTGLSDEKIMEMDKSEVFENFCKWNGLLGNWSEDILEVIEDIYGVELGN